MGSHVEEMRQKIDRTGELNSVVHTMKALAASKIGQYEQAVRALDNYYQAVLLGLSVCLKGPTLDFSQNTLSQSENSGIIVLFGSDQGLVGQFNEILARYFYEKKEDRPAKSRIIAVGERIEMELTELNVTVDEKYATPNSVQAITTLVGQLLMQVQMQAQPDYFFIYYNRPKGQTAYEQAMKRLLPLDKKWIRARRSMEWPSTKKPEIMGDQNGTLSALIREYLFVSLFKTCAESLAAENASRLAAMQRAEKNIKEKLEELQMTYHQVRQNTIDEELFDIVSGFEAIKGAD